MIKQYLAYLRNNPEGYWFKAKLYGWGWTPATWQGWVILLSFISWCVYNFRRLDAVSHSNSDTLRPFIIQTSIVVFLLWILTAKKWEKPRWQWGLPEKKLR